MKHMDITSVLNQKREAVEAYLSSLPRGEQNLLTESMAYSLRAGGKRLRPSLFLLVAELYGGDESALMPFAAGIEMIHTYSLIHDDLPAMDNDDYRRGKLTNHKVYGEAQAILAGDGLLTEAFAMMTSVCPAVPAERVVSAVNAAARLAGTGGMVFGQTLDVKNENVPVTLNQLKEIHAGKTGALIVLSLITAAILCGAEESDVSALTEYGYKLGLAFQITDDILDCESSFEELGKPVGSDSQNGKTTYISLLGKEEAQKAAREACDAACAALRNLSVDPSLLCAVTESVLNRKK